MVTVTEVIASEPSVSSSPAPDRPKPADTKHSDRSRSLSCALAASATDGAADQVAWPASASTASHTMVVVALAEPVPPLVLSSPDRKSVVSGQSVAGRVDLG